MTRHLSSSDLNNLNFECNVLKPIPVYPAGHKLVLLSPVHQSEPLTEALLLLLESQDEFFDDVQLLLSNQETCGDYSQSELHRKPTQALEYSVFGLL